MPRRSPLRRLAPLAALLSFALPATAAAAGAPGELDATFGGEGVYLISDVDAGTTVGATSLAVDGQGRPLLGYRDDFSGHVGVRRLLPAGFGDETFGPGDGAPGDSRLPAYFGDVEAVTIAPGTGRVILAGRGDEDEGDGAQPQGLLTDRGPTGREDGGWTSRRLFEIDGFPTTPKDAVVLPDGRIVVVGEIAKGGQSHGFVARFSTSGTIDTSFGNGGAFVLAAPDADSGSSLRGVALQGDRIVAAGSAYRANDAATERFLAVRFTAGGQPDATFAGGAVTLEPGTAASQATDVVVTPGGIVVSGWAIAERRGLAAVRVTEAGAIDGSFGAGGATVVTGDAALDAGGSAVDQHGRVLLAGSVNSSGRWVVARLTASGGRDATFGAGGLAVRTASAEGHSSTVSDVVVHGDRAFVAGATQAFGAVRPGVMAVFAGGEPAGGGNDGGGGGGTQPQPQPEVTPPAPGPEMVTVRGVPFTVVASTERLIDIPNFAAAGNWHWTSAAQIMQDKVPYLDLSWEFDDAGCGKGKEGVVGRQTPAGGKVTISPSKPLKVRWKICLETDELAKDCSAKKIEKTFKKGDDYSLYDAVLGEIAKCKVDYDVKFTKKADPTPDFKTLKNTKAPEKAKRKPIEAALECSTAPELQSLNLSFSEGVSVGSSYGFHKSDPQKGWTLPAGVTSYFTVRVNDKSNGMAPVAAKVFVDTDDVGAAQIKPRMIDGRGELVFMVAPRKTGTIRVCAVYEAGNGAVAATAAIQVVGEPKVGEVWETFAGRRIEMTKTGPKQVAGFGGASAAWNIGDAWNAIVALFGGRSPQVNQVASSSQTPGKKVAAATKSGVGVAQMSNGGTLGRSPGLPSTTTGTVYTSTGDGRFAVAKGPVVTKNPNGTLLGKADKTIQANVNGVVAGGGGNIIGSAAYNLLSDNGLGLISDNGLGLIGTAAGNLIGAAGGNLIGPAAGNLTAANAAGVVAAGSAN